MQRVAKLLLSLGANQRLRAGVPCAEGVTPLHLAAFFGHTPCVRGLLDNLASQKIPANQHDQHIISEHFELNGISSNDLKPLDLAVAAGSLECVAALATAGASCTTPCRRLLGPVENGTYARLMEVVDSDTGEFAKRLGHTAIFNYILTLPEYISFLREKDHSQVAHKDPQEEHYATKPHNQSLVASGKTAEQLRVSFVPQLFPPLRPSLSIPFQHAAENGSTF